MKKLFTCAALASVALLSMPASAAVNLPVPTANYITFGGADWAWAAPCAPFAPTCGGVDFSYQATQGWRLPTAAEFLAGPTAANFGTAQSFKCAAAWFSTVHSHCDYNDGVILAVFGHPGNPFPGNGAVETWVIRGNMGVPEPATWAMMIGGFGLAGAAMRRRATKTSVTYA